MKCSTECFFHGLMHEKCLFQIKRAGFFWALICDWPVVEIKGSDWLSKSILGTQSSFVVASWTSLASAAYVFGHTCLYRLWCCILYHLEIFGYANMIFIYDIVCFWLVHACLDNSASFHNVHGLIGAM